MVRRRSVWRCERGGNRRRATAQKPYKNPTWMEIFIRLIAFGCRAALTETHSQNSQNSQTRLTRNRNFHLSPFTARFGDPRTCRDPQLAFEKKLFWAVWFCRGGGGAAAGGVGHTVRAHTRHTRRDVGSERHRAALRAPRLEPRRCPRPRQPRRASPPHADARYRRSEGRRRLCIRRPGAGPGARVATCGRSS